MLENEHKLEIGQIGLVGRVAADGQPRIALDVGRDAAYFDNPYLPDTRSEMALPLKVRDKIIGVLDVQSKHKNIFSQDDTEVFEALANQVAIAIENARLAEETQSALEEAQEISKQYIHQAWTQLAASQQKQGYRYTEKHVYPLSQKTTDTGNKNEILSIPVQLHDETIGVLEISRNETTNKLDEEALTVVRAIANRAALALENARLLEETTRRAGRERLVSDITTKIRSTNDPETMIQTALKELKQALGASKVELATQANKKIGTEHVD
jgi:GAF domain-containing protein